LAEQELEYDNPRPYPTVSGLSSEQLYGLPNSIDHSHGANQEINPMNFNPMGAGMGSGMNAGASAEILQYLQANPETMAALSQSPNMNLAMLLSAVLQQQQHQQHHHNANTIIVTPEESIIIDNVFFFIIISLNLAGSVRMF
jgi:hypothetical protein